MTSLFVTRSNVTVNTFTPLTSATRRSAPPRFTNGRQSNRDVSERRDGFCNVSMVVFIFSTLLSPCTGCVFASKSDVIPPCNTENPSSM
ncbi:unnamed protein product [Haemonchus placei]|uniref:Secreted protein n=1 Tax=Haemonchus placei TaxID=6290 RepID=A0A158QLF0_HAEPC|nr:unnamed protein product [Haemonchus placei]